ncbi:DsbA family protein [Rhodococcus sp. NPDC057014]|uniref:mycothiol-dependent nitroreductase Rv2466c family protein n=1 Tax=Rhodococcus sp. NPDC057014 TaxID=3346000 RepID=UPI003629BB69
MQRLEFYFDPSCPFCWITSRWLLQVADERDLDITWRPFSLAEKNDEVANDRSDKTSHGDLHRPAHRVHRVIAAAAKHGAAVIDLYSAFGRPYHVDGREYDDALIAQVLVTEGLPTGLARAADETSWDAYLRDETSSAVAAVGEDTGVPIIVFKLENGEKKGLYGPVLNNMPNREDALALWDGLRTLAPVSAFYELKRTRPDGLPDTSGTEGI